MMPKKIGNFLIVDKIYETDISILYKAVECVNGQKGQLFYGLKLLKKGHAQELSLHKEVQFTHMLDNAVSENILIPALKVLSEDGEEYAIMRFYHHGLFLSELIAQLEERFCSGNIPLALLFEILEIILNALHSLHSCSKYTQGKGFLHMDIHPGNVFLENCSIEQGRIGSVKFLDFQNSLAMDSEGLARQSSSAFFTSPGYSAPELFGAQNSTYTEATDLYSVAAIGARMFTGHHMSTLYETFHSYVKAHTAEVHVNGVVKHQLEHFFRIGLDFNQMYRFQTAEAMKAAVLEMRRVLEYTQRSDYFSLFEFAYRRMISVELAVSGTVPCDPKGFAEAVSRLKQYLDSHDKDTLCSYYIYRCLWKMKLAESARLNPESICELISCGLNATNFLGKSTEAVELFAEFQQYREFYKPKLGEYFELCTYAAESYVDTCQFQKAYELNLENLEFLNIEKKQRRDYAGRLGLNAAFSAVMEERGIVCSAVARYMSFQNSWNKSAPVFEEKQIICYFQEALDEFKNDPDNRAITLSHLLHYAVEIGDEPLLQEYAPQYIGRLPEACGGMSAAPVLRARLNELLRPNKVVSLWKLWIFLKAVYKFYLVQLDSDFLSVLRQAIRENWMKESMAFPVELIYRLMALILACHPETEAAEEIQTAFLRALQYPQNEQINPQRPLNIRMLTKYQILWDYQNYMGEQENNRLLHRILTEQSRRCGWQELTSQLERMDSLENLLVYEHW